MYTLESIFSVPKNASTEFVNIATGETVHFPKSLIIPEDIDCKKIAYSFDTAPESVRNLTVNKEFIPFLKKMNIDTIKQFFFNVEHGHIKVSDPSLVKKIKKFSKKKLQNLKSKLISLVKRMIN
jgi:hypothetical protein